MSTSPITARKTMQGYVAASLRQRCATCQHQKSLDALWLTCSRGGFAVTAYAVCNDWTVKLPNGLKTPNAQ